VTDLILRLVAIVTFGFLAEHESRAANSIVVANNSELRTVSTRQFSFVTRLTYDGGAAHPLQFVASGRRCSLNSGEGDGVSEVQSADGKCWLGLFPAGGIDIRQFGCVLDGAFDCYPSIVGALALARKTASAVLIPNGVARSSRTILAGEVKINGEGLISPTTPSPSGSQIRCDYHVKECLVAGLEGATAGGANVSNLIVSFSEGDESGKAIIIQGNNARCDGLMAYNSNDAFYFRAGISAHCNNLYSWNVRHCHIIDDGYPELYINHARLGLNGEGDQAESTCFIGLTGRDPNGVVCNLCQFNLGSKSPRHLVSYYSLTREVNGIVQISNSVIDMSLGNCRSLVHSDRTAFVFRMQISGSAVNAPKCTLLDYEGRPPVSFQVINNAMLAIGPSVIDTQDEESALVFDISHNAQITGNITLNSGPGGGRGIFSKNQLSGDLSITSTGSPWKSLVLTGNIINGKFHNSAFGSIQSDVR
jgi:hypothetical protein